MLRVSSVLYLQQVWERTSSETELDQVEEEDFYNDNDNINTAATNIITNGHNNKAEQQQHQHQEEEPEQPEQKEQKEPVIQPATTTLLQIPDAITKTSTISRSTSSARSSTASLSSSFKKNREQTSLTTVPVPSLQYSQQRSLKKKKKISLTNMKHPRTMSSFATTFASETRKLTAQVLKRNTQPKQKQQVLNPPPLPAPFVPPKNNIVGTKKHYQPKTDKFSDIKNDDDDDDSGIANSQEENVGEGSEVVYTQVYNQEQDNIDIYRNDSVSTTATTTPGNNSKNKDTATTATTATTTTTTTATNSSEESAEDSGVAASTSAATSSSAQQTPIINAEGAEHQARAAPQEAAASRRATQLYHFYYGDDENNNNNKEQERRNSFLPSPLRTTDDIHTATVVVNDDSSGGTSSMPPTPTSIQRRQQNKQNDTSSIRQQTGKTLRREASRLSMKRKNITKKLKKAMSFQKSKKTNEETAV